MKWWPEDCRPGDMIRVRAGAVWHYGIFVSEDEVIEFGPPPVGQEILRNAEFRVMAVDIDAFSAGGIVERARLDRAEERRRIPPEETVRLARSRLGEGGYDLLHNNCEHFAHACVFGEHRSLQEETMRQKWLNRPILDVFVTAIPDDLEPEAVFPPARNAWIEAAPDPETRRARYAVWKLLERGIDRSFHLRMEELEFTETRGKWSCDRLCFSLSHSGSFAAAAVSTAAVGVDVETSAGFAAHASADRRAERLLRRLRAAEERKAPGGPEDEMRLRTKAESIFKCCGESGLRAGKSAAHETLTFALRQPEPCILSVCGEALERTRIFLADETGLRALSADEMKHEDGFAAGMDGI